MKIAWFSPLPPEHSDIANFTARLAADLQATFETRFFTETAGGFLEPAERADYPAELGGIAPTLLPVLNRLDLPVYNLGNNPSFFSHTWFLSQSKPGIVVLHDLKLHHFFEGIYRERLGDMATYLRVMKRHYGQIGYEAGVAYWRQEVSIDFMAEHFPMTEWALSGALAVVVHTVHSLKVVQSLTSTPVVLAPLPYQPRATLRPSPLPDEPRTGTMPVSKPARLVIFGYLNVNRRVVEFLEALAAMPERARFDLQILGTVFHRAEVEAAVDRLHLRSQVTLHGYVSEEVLEAALDRADLAINLRYPTMGEASGSQLRIWDHALPSLVTWTDAYADLPADTVFFVRPDQEATDIQRHLRHLLDQPEAFREAGRRGKEWLLAHHLPSAYVRTLDELCQNSETLRARHTQWRAAERIGAGIAPWMEAAPCTAREEHYAATVARTL